VSYLDVNAKVVAQLKVPSDRPTFKSSLKVAAIVVEFTGEVAQPSVVTGAFSPVANPASLDFLVKPSSQRFPNGYVPGRITFASATVAKFTIEHPEFKFFPQGEYEVRLFGDPDPTPGVARPAITSVALSRLDGEVNANFPSGNNAEGGNFAFAFTVQ
jgi:hypothetical protein